MDSQSELNRQRLEAHRAKLSAQPATAKPLQAKPADKEINPLAATIVIALFVILCWLIATPTKSSLTLPEDDERAMGKRAKQFHEDRKNFEDAIRTERDAERFRQSRPR